MPIIPPDYSDSEEERELEAQYKVLRKILISSFLYFFRNIIICHIIKYC